MKKLKILIQLFFISNCISAQVSFTLANTACVGNTATVTANNGTTTITGYTWSASPGGPVFSSPGASITTIFFPNAGTFSIAVTGTSTGGPTFAVNTITVFPTPTVGIALSSSSACIVSNYPKISNYILMTGSGASSYSWVPYSGPNPSASTVYVMPATSTCYTVYGITNGCRSFTTACISFVPQFTVGVSPLSGILCKNDSIKLRVVSIQTLSSGTHTFHYLWSSQPNTNSFGPSSMFVSPQNSTTYTVEVFDNFCISFPQLINITVFICSGIETNPNDELDCLVYPNPFENLLNLDLQDEITGDIKMTVTDIFGKIIYHSDHLASKQSIDLTGFSKGIYFMNIQKPGTGRIIKILKN